jgi:hypothetical protein
MIELVQFLKNFKILRLVILLLIRIIILFLRIDQRFHLVSQKQNSHFLLVVFFR